MTPLIRPARPDELEPLLALQQRSMRELGAEHYARDVLEAALARMGTMDPRLIGDGTYLVAELDGRLAGGAGWTLRAPTFAPLLAEALPPLHGRPAVVRSVYVEPALARRGIARHLMAAVEARLLASGAARAELLAMTCGVPFYRALGYDEVSDHALLLAGRMEFVVRRMARPLRALDVAA
jgi:GNAT superfamily N-acetyltransferase